MARGRPAAAAANRIVSGAFVFGGIFLVCFGFGLSNVAVIVAGVLVAALTLGARITNGLRPRPRQWLPGTGRVLVVADAPPATGEFGRCELQISVDAPGMPTETVTVRDPRVPVSQWPQPGLLLPIEVAADNVRNVRIRWYGQPVPEPVNRVGDVLDDDPDPVPRTPPGSHLDPPPDPEFIDFDLDEVAVGPTEAGGMDEGHVRRSEQTVALDLRTESDPDPAEMSWTDAEAAALAEADAQAVAAADAEATALAGLDPEPSVPADAELAPPPAVEPALPAEPPVEPVAAEEAVEPVAAEPTVEPVPIEPVVTEVTPVVPVRQRRRPSPYPRHAEEPVGVPAPSLGLAPEPDAGSDLRPGPAAAPAGIAGLGVTLVVSDLPASTRFYQDTLGFEAVDGGEQTVVLAAGGVRLVLRAGDIGRENRRLVHLNLMVEDIDAAHSELRAKGVRFISGPKVMERGARSELWAATFRDPDGHGVALTQWRAAVAPSPA